MHQKENEFLLGELSASVRNLTAAVDQLSADVRYLRVEINEVKLFRARILGMASVLSVLSSVLCTLLVHYMRAYSHG